MSDIRFYDFDFNLLYILPSFSVDSGYISVNTQQDFNNSGAFECVFMDNDLKKIIENLKDTILVVWEDFQGFITSYKWDNQLRITGMHLNGLLHRAVIPNTVTVLNSDVETIARSAITKNVGWLVLGDEKGFENSVQYSTEKYMPADEYIRKLLNLDCAGYLISADVKQKVFKFELLKINDNSLMLSENNLNAYGFEETYINKNLAYGGWYEKEQPENTDGAKAEPVWTYITVNEEKEGIHKIDCILSAKNESDAINELKEKKAKYEVLLKTKNLVFNKDYKLGDVLRVQKNGITTKKLVIGISKWKEKSYGEEPILTEVQ